MYYIYNKCIDKQNVSKKQYAGVHEKANTIPKGPRDKKSFGSYDIDR